MVHSSVPVRIACVVLPISACSFLTPKAGNFKDAYDFWKIVYDECPAATKDIYLYGVKIMGWKIAQEKDPAKKKALIDDLMSVYDKRVKYFGNDRKYGKDWIVARKVQDYLSANWQTMPTIIKPILG